MMVSGFAENLKQWSFPDGVFMQNASDHNAIINCLENESSMLELLPSLILRFRENKIGVTAGIRKTFQTIQVAEKDRDYLKFLWWDQKPRGRLKIYRHTQVVFGLHCNPIPLAVVIEYHLQKDIAPQSVTKRKWVTFEDSEGIRRVKTKLIDNINVEYAVTPALLPCEHPMVELLIDWYHKSSRHAGTQYLIAKIRERFWLPRCRKTIQKIVRKCTTCSRYSGKSYMPVPCSLPKNRLTAESAFQTTGVDLAGPLYLKNGKKVWMTLFTCAVYRCVHLDLVSSLNTETFINALERFVNTCGKPTVIYSDNGTNFVGTANLFKTIRWKEVEQKMQNIRIKWIFNPPTAAWWGGWWERLIRSVKDLLKRMLGQTRLDYEQLRTCLSHAERVINDRPLTAATEDVSDLMVLTPGMFMLGNIPGNLAETQAPEVINISEEFKRRKTIQKELENRFKREYLSLLVQKAHDKPTVSPQLGDIVLIGSDDRKRSSWPLGRIIEVYAGQDSEIRVVRLQTANGQMTRPIQRLYPLEMNIERNNREGGYDKQPPSDKPTTPDSQEKKPDSQEEKSDSQEKKPDSQEEKPESRTTRSGRQIKQPKKYQDYRT